MSARPKKPRAPAKTPNAFIRFNAHPDVEEEIDTLHSQISAARYTGLTIERLVKAALQMVNDPANIPAIPADIMAIRRQLGKVVEYPVGEEAIGTSFSAPQIALLLSHSKAQAAQVADLIDRMEKLLPTGVQKKADGSVKRAPRAATQGAHIN